MREALEHLDGADREALGVARALEQDRELLVLHPGARAAPPAPLLDHDAALLVDLLALEGDAAGPVLQDLEPSLEDLRVVGRDLQHVDGLVEAGVGVEVGPEAHADAFEVVDQLVAGEALVPLNAMCSTKWARPRWVSSSTIEPTLTSSRSSARSSGLGLART